MPAMKDKRHYLSACTVNDEHIYAFGGFFGSTEQEINDSIEMFDVEKNIWQVLSVRMKVSNNSDLIFIFLRIHCGHVQLLVYPRLKSS
jgi:N-acetylneuraminic acid mutarotase